MGITQLHLALLLAQAAPTDPGFYAAWDKVGTTGILVAVIFFGIYMAKRLIDREVERTDSAEGRTEKLRTALENLVRAYERLATEALQAERDAAAELKNVNVNSSQLIVSLSEVKASLEAAKSEIVRLQGIIERGGV